MAHAAVCPLEGSLILSPEAAEGNGDSHAGEPPIKLGRRRLPASPRRRRTGRKWRKRKMKDRIDRRSFLRIAGMSLGIGVV